MIYLLNLRTLVYIFVTPFILVFLMVWAVNSFENLINSFYCALTATVVFFVLLNLCWKQLWQLCPFMGKLVFPDISGEWNMKIQWRISCDKCAQDAVQSGQRVEGEKSGKARISQNIFAIDIVAETDESNSETLIVQPKKEKGRCSLYYIYRNIRKSTDGKKNTTHEGAVVLHIEPSNMSEIAGNYFTGRCTEGRVIFVRKEN